MITYSFLQHYWWFLISLLGGILAFLLFVQGGQTLLFSLSKTEDERRLLVNTLGRKWEFTFTTLVTLLLHKLWWCLLGMDGYSFLLYYTGCIL
jgi:cytochrome bd ubiquinol oxidase subunit II